MSPWRRERGAIGLARDGVAWRVARQEHSAVVIPSVSISAGASEVGALKAALDKVFAAEPAVRSWTMVLAPDVALPFMFDAPEGVRGMTELAQLGRLRAARLFSGAPLDWEIAADFQLHGPSLCTAAPASALAAIRNAAGEAGRRVEVVAATSLAYARLWDHADIRSGALAWPMPGHLALVTVEGGNLRSLRCFRVADERDATSWADRVLTEATREAMLTGRALGSVTCAWPGPVPDRSERAISRPGYPLRWLDARKVLPAWPCAGEGAAAWSARLAVGEASWAAR